MRKGSSGTVRRDAVPREEVFDSARAWAEEARAANPSIVRIGCFGSYARGDHLPSSDLDLFVEVGSSELRMIDRGDGLPPTTSIPVGVDLFVYTSDEIRKLADRSSEWILTIEREAVWV